VQTREATIKDLNNSFYKEALFYHLGFDGAKISKLKLDTAIGPNHSCSNVHLFAILDIALWNV
jgi:hypothetical protein